LRKCTIRRVQDSSLSHSKPARYAMSSSSSACQTFQECARRWTNTDMTGTHPLLELFVDGIECVLDGDALEVPCCYL
jgi:hypothetical protein